MCNEHLIVILALAQEKSSLFIFLTFIMVGNTILVYLELALRIWTSIFMIIDITLKYDITISICVSSMYNGEEVSYLLNKSFPLFEIV